MTRRRRRSFSKEFKAEVVRLILEENRSAHSVAKELDLTYGSVLSWVKQAKVDQGRGGPGAVTSAEREELRKLRSENRQLRMEREILKKAAAFFAKENQ